MHTNLGLTAEVFGNSQPPIHTGTEHSMRPDPSSPWGTLLLLWPSGCCGGCFAMGQCEGLGPWPVQKRAGQWAMCQGAAGLSAARAFGPRPVVWAGQNVPAAVCCAQPGATSAQHPAVHVTGTERPDHRPELTIPVQACIRANTSAPHVWEHSPYPSPGLNTKLAQDFFEAHSSRHTSFAIPVSPVLPFESRTSAVL